MEGRARPVVQRVRRSLGLNGLSGGGAGLSAGGAAAADRGGRGGARDGVSAGPELLENLERLR